jgi:hypothetical protein
MTLKELNLCFQQRMEKIEQDREFDNRRTARICTIIANANRDSKKKPRPFKEDDFMPKKVEKKKKKMSVNQMATMLKTITIAYGGKVVR